MLPQQVGFKINHHIFPPSTGKILVMDLENASWKRA
jgi:hypothetical protein